MLKPHDKAEIVKAVEQGMNGRCVKAVTLTLVFDQDDNLIAKTDVSVQKFFPAEGILRFFGYLEGRRLTP
jgi:hypothetical protein